MCWMFCVHQTDDLMCVFLSMCLNDDDDINLVSDDMLYRRTVGSPSYIPQRRAAVGLLSNGTVLIPLH